MYIKNKNKVFIIAEAGVNHNGKLEYALEMVKLAKKAGADCIKFQAFTLNTLVSNQAKSTEYQKKNTGVSEQKNILKTLILKRSDFVKIKNYCDKLNIEFLCTAFDNYWLDFFISIGMNKIKVPSGEITNFNLLEHIASKKLPVILSTGMSNKKEIKAALSIIKRKLKKKYISLLHCTSLYPAPDYSLNLLAINTMRKEFGLDVGYSDHSSNFLASIAAVSMGAHIIEKHFTLNKKLSGPDHKASLNIKQLNLFINDIRSLEIWLGDGNKISTVAEKSVAKLVRRSWHATKNINKNQKISKNNVTLLRPEIGISGTYNIIGKLAKKNILKGNAIFQNDLFKK